MSAVAMSWSRRVKQVVRYGVVPAGIFMILLLLTLFLIPVVVNVQRFVPEIETLVTEGSGRPFSLGSDFNVTFFPSLSLSFSDMKLGNPSGFGGDEFMNIRTFEARIKILPLLRKKIEFSRFVVGGLSLNLEKNSSGQENWHLNPKASSASPTQGPMPPVLAGLAEHFAFTLLAVTDGQITWRDKKQNIDYRVEDIMLVLNDFSSTNPVTADCRANFNGRPVAVDGKVGPVQMQKGVGTLPVDLSFNVANTLQGKLRGTIAEQKMASELAIIVSPFSPREFFSAGNFPFDLSAIDPQVFTKLALEMVVKGGKEKILIEKATGHLDDSNFFFTFEAKNPGSPEIGFTIDLDRIDLDRYLPSVKPTGKDLTKEGKRDEGPASDHRLAREIALGGVVKIGELKAFGSTLAEVNIPVQGKDGLFTFAPAANAAYGGKVETHLTLDMQDDEPAIQATFAAQGLAAEPLLRDLFGWDKLHGTLSAEITMEAAGDTLQAIHKSIDGQVRVQMQDGALAGVDLARPDVIAGRANGLNSDDPAAELPRLEFTEAKGAAIIKDGILYLKEADLGTPAAWIQLSGTIDTILRQMDVQVESGYEVTVKGKGGREEKTSQSSRFLITGPFSGLTLNNLTNHSGPVALSGKMNARYLVEQKLPSPVDDDVKNLVGKDLVDPVVVAQRFGLQPDILRRSEVKKKLPVGSGKVNIGTLQEEPALP
ncbi:MAG: AsmA family protein [Desulforhopalus sp.]|nr:AsmA family protein [Desulforhopalus sp.]